MIQVIAIDGVAGSGKSTLAKSLARELDWAYFDTGAMYRSLALLTIRHNIDATNEDAVVAALADADIQVSPDPDGVYGLTFVTLNGEDISKEIRTGEIGPSVAKVAVHPKVREMMVMHQQKWINDNGNSVVEGRDISAVVWPDAILKIYLTADLEERARRREAEIASIHAGEDSSDTEQLLANRDASDSTKGGLIRVDGAVEIDTTNDTPEATLKRVLVMLKAQ